MHFANQESPPKVTFYSSMSCSYWTCCWCWGIVEGGSLQETSPSAPLGVTQCHPQSSFSMELCFLGMRMRRKGHNNFFALCPATLIPRGFCLLGQWAPEAGVCREWLRLHLPREQELDPPVPLELWTGESQPYLWPIQVLGLWEVRSRSKVGGFSSCRVRPELKNGNSKVWDNTPKS